MGNIPECKYCIGNASGDHIKHIIEDGHPDQFKAMALAWTNCPIIYRPISAPYKNAFPWWY